MPEEQITIEGRIMAVTATHQIHKVVRDTAGEEKVWNELKASLWAETHQDQIPMAVFMSQYRSRLEAYAKYVHGTSYSVDSVDGKPILLVPKLHYEHEVRVRYTVDGKIYNRTLTCLTEQQYLAPRQSFFLTVDKNNPVVVFNSATDDYRVFPPPTGKVGEIGGGFFVMILLLLFMLMMAAAGR